jgi:hypothetical protein
MSLTSAAWVALGIALAVLSFRRPAYGVSLYMLTFFAAPEFWWWGDELPPLRYASLAGIALLAAVVFRAVLSSESGARRFSIVHAVAILIALNATFVHFALASTPSISVGNYVELLKLVLLVFLMTRAIENRDDLRIVLMSIALGAAYIGYEVWWNERGYFSGGRLEGVGAPGADGSNSLADLMLFCLPLIGSLFINGRRHHKLTTIIAAPLALNVLLLCNSRGAFIGLLGAALTFLLVARGPTRKQAVRSLALGGIVFYLLLGDPEILERFATTFAGSEERDASAASRIDFWKAGLMMMADYPLGDGGGSFKYVRGGYYLSQVMGQDAVDRSLHNGYLTEGTEWGVQGLLLRLLFLGAALLAASRTAGICRQEGRHDDALLGTCLIVSVAGYLVHCFFGSFISNEWGYWSVVLLVRYGELYRAAELFPAPAEPARLGVWRRMPRRAAPASSS